MSIISSSSSSSCSSIKNCSNLENFLHSVTPVIKHASIPVNDDVGLKNAHAKLQDIWEIYDEWSCCGVGVPVLLESDESIVQYYVPYLSAIQIFIKKSTSSTSDDDDDDVSTKSNDMNLGKKVSSGEHDDDDDLYVQFYETCSPYMRVPLLDKVTENDEEGDERGQVSDLVPFGLATYKMQGDVWNNRDKGDDEKIKDLESAASSWLRRSQNLYPTSIIQLQFVHKVGDLVALILAVGECDWLIY
ncbi:hypothetical protein L1987_56432 [Smallanthus sonchifolius]|uniref:Uncharacterized protein n=1 Tax=Smallanthus sonchifolius TaxID=185202 RepID=A0ACB9ED40_9ASTR|nr:hypothetical protein L1987_56432 [Smallanthus sonchifolius]